MSPDIVAAERAVLGSAMLSHTAAEDVVELLTVDDFSEWQRGDVFAVIVSLLNGGQQPDVIAVTDRLIEQGDLGKIGGAAFLHEMTSEVPTAANARYYAEIVREAAHRRRLTIAVDRARNVVETGTGRAFDLASTMRDEIESVLDDIVGTHHVPGIVDEFDDVVADLAEQPRFIPTAWPDVNDLIDGFRPGALYVVGARPGGGKSIVGLMAAATLAKHGPVAMSSLEMSRREIILRLISARAGVSLKALVRHAVQPAQWDAIAAHREKITALPLFIDDRGGVTMSAIRAHVRATKRRGILTGVVVDYLQLVKGDSSRPRWEAVGDITRELKAIAREFDVPVIALAQLNRRTEGGVARPGLGDLRESGSIEQDADVVMLLSRVVDPDTQQEGDELEVIVAKNRHGQTGVATLFWEGGFARVTDLGRFR